MNLSEQEYFSKLKKFAPGARADILEAIATGKEAAIEAGLTTPLRLQHFLAQIAHESTGFSVLIENMNYSASRMMAVFGEKGRRKARNGLTLAKAKQLDELGPEATANFLYGGDWGRKNLGNTEVGDGWKYRGSGIMQTTGRANFAKATARLGIPLLDNPDLLRDPKTAFRVACLEWKARACNGAADRDDIRDVTQRINGGENGLADRMEWLEKAKRIFPAAIPVRDAAPAIPPRVEIEQSVTVPPGLGEALRDSIARKPPAPPEPVAGTVAAPVPAPSTVTGWIDYPGALTKEGNPKLRLLQVRLRDGLGYKIVGDPDGIWGKNTIAGLAAFRAVNEIDDVQADLAVPRIDAATEAKVFSLRALPSTPSRERATVTTEELQKKVPTLVNPGILSRIIGKITGVAAGLGTAFVGIVSNLDASWTSLAAAKNFITSPWTLGFIVVCFAAITYLIGSGIISAGKNAYKSQEIN